MALPATDTFTNADTTTLTAHSASWTEETSGSMKIMSNLLTPNLIGARMLLAWWNADVFNNNQYAQATVTAIGAAVYIGVAVRASASNGYCAFWETAGLVLRKIVAGVETNLSSAAAISVSDTVRIEASGTTITVKKNGSMIHQVTDSDITSGSAGMVEYSNTTVTSLDNWEGGNLIGPSILAINKSTKLRPAIFRPGNAR